MISLIVNGIAMHAMRNALAGPCAIVAGIAAILAICGCMKCTRCHMRDCTCCKRLLRVIGHDDFDDFELMVLVHEAMFERSAAKFTTVVRVTAGLHHVETDANSNGFFQQPLHLTVEQGVETIVVDLLDSHSRTLATLNLRTAEDVLGPSHHPEHTYSMRQKDKRLRNPRIKLTMAVQQEEDLEKGLLAGVSSDVDDLVRLQLAKARGEGKLLHGEGMSEFEVLRQACAGPLELFEGLGKTSNIYVSIGGPPTSRRWNLGVWKDIHDFHAKKPPMKEVDLLRIQSVQADPTRHHVFVINCYDESRVRQALTFRRTDRARDVWVEVIRLLVQKVHDARHAKQDGQACHGGHGRSHAGQRH